MIALENVKYNNNKITQKYKVVNIGQIDTVNNKPIYIVLITLCNRVFLYCQFVNTFITEIKRRFCNVKCTADCYLF